MRIGITLHTYDNHNIWNNGIGQNVYHLACALEAIPFVERVVLINTGNQEAQPADVGDAAHKFRMVSQLEATDLIDVAIEVAGALDLEWSARFRARGGRLVFHNCGQPYSALVEPTIFNKPSTFIDPLRCDEVWTLAKDAPFDPMMRAIYRCPVHQVPYLWASNFLEQSAKDLARQGDHKFGYQAGSIAKPIPAIFEPNISPIKMGTIPFMICEAAYAKMQEKIAKVWYLNGHHMAAHMTFIKMVQRFSLYADGKLAIGARDYFSHVMASGANMVVSHQLDCPQNYLYLDALFGNYPLIHNSPLFADVGYYYPNSDIGAGLEQFELAMSEHDRNLEFNAQRNAKKVGDLSPLNRANVNAYARRLINLFPSGSRGRQK